MSYKKLKAQAYRLLSPFSFMVFKFLYHRKLTKDLVNIGFHSDLTNYLLRKIFYKSYAHHSPMQFIPYSYFNYSKILYSFISLFSYSQVQRSSPFLAIDDYSHDIKHKIRAKAEGLSPDCLPEIWSSPEVAIFNCMNTIKFKKTIFKQLSFHKCSVLDVGCSVGCASWLAYRLGATSVCLSDIDGAALNVASNALSPYFKSVETAPIYKMDEYPKYGKCKYNIVFCLHVFEHTAAPMDLAKALLDSVVPGGYFVYTYYYAPVGNGINTNAGAEQRDEVLEYISSRSIKLNNSNHLNPYDIRIRMS